MILFCHLLKMNEEKQTLGEPHDARNYPEAPPPYSPYAPSCPPAGPSYIPGDKPRLAAEVWKCQPPPPTPVVVPTIVQPVIQVHTSTPTVTILGPSSMRLLCPHCRADINTRVGKSFSMAAYISSALLILLGCVFGCCLIPFCMDSCQISEHYCPSCKKFIGRYSTR